MNNIKELRILPPIAISRLGEASQPLEAYTLKVSDKKPLDFREITPLISLEVNQQGEVSPFNVDEIVFRTDEGIKPVAPFLELFYIGKDKNTLYPLTLKVLAENGYDISADNLNKYLSWDIDLANHKIYRRTQDENDKIECSVQGINNYNITHLDGKCQNFIKGKVISLGSFQVIRPTSDDEVLRARYTPAKGKVYRSNAKLTAKEKKGGLQVIEKIYDSEKGKWAGYSDGESTVPTTNPAYIYYGDGAEWKSLGYFDDACDGFIRANLLPPDCTEENKIRAKGHISSGPPDFAPDSLPIRVVTDELEQILFGIEANNPSIDEVEEIVRRSFETVRLMNTAIMNGNKVDGKESGASNMVRQDTNDTQRLYQPIMATSIVDNLALLALHERVYNGLGAGKSAWFGELLRTPEEIGDLSDEGRRKMPALMRGADARALTLTRRQIDTVFKAGEEMQFDKLLARARFGINKDDSISQLLYQAEGNPYSVLPRCAISNCFPGLEYDFRNLWRRSFKEIVLVENTNIVLKDNRNKKNQKPDLTFRFLVWVHKKQTMVAGSGPVLPNSGNRALPSSRDNAFFMEWSNNLAAIISEAQKSKKPMQVDAYFTKEKYNEPNIAPVYIPKESDLEEEVKKGNLFKATLTVQKFFAPNSTEYNDNLIQPGEMTQGLCAPWQNDFIECACYYWAASRPDYVNIVADENGVSTGDNWIAKERTGKYPPSSNIGENPELLTYEDLFKNWQNELRFIIKGKDEEISSDRLD